MMKKCAFLLFSFLLLAAVMFLQDFSLATETKPEKCDLKSIAGKCAQCKMELPEGERVPGAYTKGSVPEWSFMDIGCLLRWRDSKCMPTQVDLDSHLYVRDYDSGEEVKAVRAFYVIHSGVSTPMGSGIVVFKDEASAKTFIKGHKGASIMDYEKLVSSDIASVCDREES